MKTKVQKKKPRASSLNKQRGLSEPVRRCIASGQVQDKAKMLRFVVSPDGMLVHDIHMKLPGRGMWVTSQREMLEMALKKGLFSRSAKRVVKHDPDLPENVERSLAKRCLDLLGLGRKSGFVTTGFAKVEQSLKAGKAVALLAAYDGADDGRSKLRRLAKELPLIELFNIDELSKALGRDNAVHVCMIQSRLAEKFMAEVSKLAGFRNPGMQVEEPKSE
ncbi:RNA-binding protein [Sneathiella chinensis]|nr:RNA-binding protein [Sneathiella chinensis]